MTKQQDLPRIAILGAGPIGLEAAIYARSLGLAVTVYERGRPGEHLLRWGHVRLFSPFGMNCTPLGKHVIRTDHPKHEFPGDNDCITGREHLAAYLEPLAKSDLLKNCIKTETQVLGVGRKGFLKHEGLDGKRGGQPFRILMRDGKKAERIDEADVVLDCTGTYAQHRWLGDGGIPAAGELPAEANIVYTLDDITGDKQSAYAGKTVMVVGGGFSAATTVCNLATLGEKHPETWVVWLARAAGTTPIHRMTGDPLKERDRLAMRANMLATRGDGNVEFHAQTVVDAVEYTPDKGFKVGARVAGKPRTWEVDRVIANVGYSPDRMLYRELQVHECYASLGPMALAAALLKHADADCLAVPATGAATLKTPEPNFFILGTKSYGRSSNFLLKHGFDQVRDAFTLIMNKADLDLFKKKS